MYVDFRSALADQDRKMSKRVIKPEQFYMSRDWKEVLLGGIVLYINERDSKKGKWAVVTLQCNHHIVLMMCWNGMWEKYKSELRHSKRKKKAIVVSGKVKYDDWRSQKVLNCSEKDVLYEL